MKNIFILIIFSIFITGCQANTQNATRKADIPDSKSMSGEMTETNKAAFNAAMQLKDDQYCNKINNEEYKKFCKTEIADTIQHKMALDKADSSLCADLSGQDRQEACRIEVGVKRKELDKQHELQRQIASDEKLVLEILRNHEYQRCQELQLVASRKDCELNILTNNALRNKDVKWCDKASTEEIQSTCQEAYSKSGY